MNNNILNENVLEQDNMNQNNNMSNFSSSNENQNLDIQYDHGLYDLGMDMQFDTNVNAQIVNAEQVNVYAKKILNRIGLAMTVMAGAILLSQIVLSAILVDIFPSAEQSDWFVWILTAISMYGVGLPVVYGLTRKIPSTPKKPVKKLKIYQFIIIFFICAAAMYITNFFSVFLNFLISIIKGGEILNPALDAIFEGNFILTFLYTAIGAPIVEELIFRKILLDKVRRFGDLPAILITGIAFGLFHMNIAQIFYATALGIIFAYVTLRTNTIRYAIILHILINTIGATLAPLAIKQGNLLLSMLLGLWVIASIIIGIVFFIVFVVAKKSIQLDRGEITVSKKSVYILNVGSIIFIVICLIMTTSILLA